MGLDTVRLKGSASSGASGQLTTMVSKSFGKHWELKFNAKDLLNEKVQFAQFPKFENGGDVVSRKQITKQFTAGRMFSLSVTAKF